MSSRGCCLLLDSTVYTHTRWRHFAIITTVEKSSPHPTPPHPPTQQRARRRLFSLLNSAASNNWQTEKNKVDLIYLYCYISLNPHQSNVSAGDVIASLHSLLHICYTVTVSIESNDRFFKKVTWPGDRKYNRTIREMRFTPIKQTVLTCEQQKQVLL